MSKITAKATAKSKARVTKTPPPAEKKVPAKTPQQKDRTFHASAQLAAQAAKDTPKSAVLRCSSGFYTGSKRAGVKAGAEFIGRVATVLVAKTDKKASGIA